MRLSFRTVVAALLAAQIAEGSFLRDVVGTQIAKNRIEEELLQKAVPLEEYRANLRARGYDISLATRNLEENAYGNYANQYEAADDYYMDESYMYSFSGYSLKYAACQPVQKFSEDAVYAGEYTPMITDDIIILRLCPSNSCSSSRAFGCLYNYAEYAVAISDYVRIMLRHEMDKKQQLCNWCTSCAGRRDLNEGEGAEGQEGADQDVNNQDADNQEQDINNEEGEMDQVEGADAGDDGMADNADADADAAIDADDGYGNQAAGDDGANVVYDDDNGSYSENDACYGYKSYCFDSGVSVCAENNDDGSSYLTAEDYLNYMGCNNVNGYYLRPRCNGYDQTISMGIYYDKFCSQYAGDKVNMNSLGLGISPNAFQDFYSKGTCVDCSESVRKTKMLATVHLPSLFRISQLSLECRSLLQLERELVQPNAPQRCPMHY